jgi:septal ring factor EnvC (AmiA/AmiB activator)
VRRIFKCGLLIIAAATAAWAQDLATVERQIEGLRAQLQDVADKESTLRTRAARLEEDLEPQNVERSVSTIGTTDARALRDQRRQQLEREKAQVEGQITSLANSRGRLEAAIATAEAEAVRLRAAALAPNRTPPAQPDAAAPPTASNTPAAAPAVRKKRNPPRTTKRVKRSRPKRRATPR